MIELIYGYFILRAIVIIMLKYDLYYRFQMFACKRNSKFLYDLSKCRFCMNHHLAIIPTIIVGFLFEFDYYLFVLPLTLSSIQNLFDDRNNSK